MSDNKPVFIRIKGEVGGARTVPWLRHRDNPTEDERTFFAALDTYGPGWATVIVPESDPRHAGMWFGGYQYAATGEWAVPHDQYGWHIQPGDYDVLPDPDPTPEGGGVSTGEDVPPVVFTQEDIDRARREGRRAAEAEFERWKESATETAHQYANDNSLCSEFDRCMEEIGLPPREREHTVTLTYRVTVHASPTADNYDIKEGALESLDVSDDLIDWTVD